MVLPQICRTAYFQGGLYTKNSSQVYCTNRSQSLTLKQLPFVNILVQYWSLNWVYASLLSSWTKIFAFLLFSECRKEETMVCTMFFVHHYALHHGRCSQLFPNICESMTTAKQLKSDIHACVGTAKVERFWTELFTDYWRYTMLQVYFLFNLAIITQI